MTGVWWGTLTSLSRNFFTDLRKTSVDMPKPRFVSSMSQSANDFFSSFFTKEKKLEEGTSIRRVKGHSVVKGGPNLFVCAFVMFLNPISMIFDILNKVWLNFKKLLFFSCRYKNVRVIEICLKPHFYK